MTIDKISAIDTQMMVAGVNRTLTLGELITDWATLRLGPDVGSNLDHSVTVVLRNILKYVEAEYDE